LDSDTVFGFPELNKSEFVDFSVEIPRNWGDRWDLSEVGINAWVKGNKQSINKKFIVIYVV
jgi:hypothetical protein